MRVPLAVAAFGRKPLKFNVALGLAATNDGGGLPSAAMTVLDRSGFRQKAAEFMLASIPPNPYPFSHEITKFVFNLYPSGHARRARLRARPTLDAA